MRSQTASTIAHVRDLLAQANRLLDDVIGDSAPEDLRQAEVIEELQEKVFGAMLDASKLVDCEQEPCQGRGLNVRTSSRLGRLEI